MTNLLDTLKADRMKAMKAGDTRTKDVLTVLLGDLESDSKRGNTVDDGYIIRTIKKYIMNASETYRVTNDPKFGQEVHLLGVYLPKQMSDDDLAEAIDGIIDAGHDNIGSVMKELKANYDGQFDGKTASELARQMLG